eukprot:TRINITY_DN797_c0_g1_i1.p1 TRINITY_DN797_c0_g1~~TRINITY_DN797_c0_g1_i1.p1  ORF type:complete len:704 (-),score=121.36 TRINITY_DN797_c0_g1_i1:246-2357(-)
MQTERNALITLGIVAVCALMCGAVIDAQHVSPSVASALNGPYGTDSFEYKYDAVRDDPVLKGYKTELWAHVWFSPDYLAMPASKSPILFLLHGNHGTCGTGESPRYDYDCSYTFSGQCPDGYVVVPNHMGYEYVANILASHGYIVVSINANRGITCNSGGMSDFGLNLARGRLVLRHIQLMSNVNNNIFRQGTPSDSKLSTFVGKINFDEVGMMGHSRGGEGVRAAASIYRRPDSPVPPMILDAINFKAIFEIGAVDGQTRVSLNAPGLAWVQLLPMCDGDVSDLQGMKPFDRMLVKGESSGEPKALYFVYGTNHNFYNTEWQTSDSTGCTNHRAVFGDVNPCPAQTNIGAIAMVSFFLNNVGSFPNPLLPGLYDTEFALPSMVTNFTRVDRGYMPSMVAGQYISLEDFSKASGQSSTGQTIDSEYFESYSHSSVPEAHYSAKAAAIRWSGATNARRPYLQVNFDSSAGAGLDLTAYNYINLRLARQEGNNYRTVTELTIRLVGPRGALSQPVTLSSELQSFDGPYGGPYNLHTILRTVQISFSRFQMDMTKIYGIRFDMNSNSGAIYISRISASFNDIVTTMKSNVFAESAQPWDGATSTPTTRVSTRVIDAQDNKFNVIESGHHMLLRFESTERFPVGDALLVLCVDGEEFYGARHPDGNTYVAEFSISKSKYEKIQFGDVAISHGKCASSKAMLWKFQTQ